jgi:hypothetical protein
MLYVSLVYSIAQGIMKKKEVFMWLVQMQFFLQIYLIHGC